MRFVKLVLPVLMMVSGGCGYQLATKKANAGAGRTIAVPTFTNNTTTYRIEQRLTESLRRELVRRTKYKVVSGSTGDVVIAGEVHGYGAFPNTITAGRASSYVIGAELRITVTDTQSGEVLFKNESWVFRENFELAPNSAEFVPEEPAAVDRIGSAFASSLVAFLLNRAP